VDFISETILTGFKAGAAMTIGLTSFPNYSVYLAATITLLNGPGILPHSLAKQT
jgi:hypothetical protein